MACSLGRGQINSREHRLMTTDLGRLSSEKILANMFGLEEEQAQVFGLLQRTGTVLESVWQYEAACVGVPSMCLLGAVVPQMAALRKLFNCARRKRPAVSCMAICKLTERI